MLASFQIMPDISVKKKTNKYNVFRCKYDLVIAMCMVHFLDIFYGNEKIM